ncbi:hypothetical protein PGT21_025649 [Puccinia graminis f. sp. tritici]|uniref:Uncharacterized protein n=1 Tax=Puccinia graminis f. sp. tritici TaxID=56615 RepID=A0A5B0LXJ7_PUCGR|nr:hypothetical protein PGTUg99_019176 [Puccinia graminis f. sp. tritici]KAA1104515.1 hypothetical protein PGT21_025649 [Puccinia graminis f. sp. tritici]
MSQIQGPLDVRITLAPIQIMWLKDQQSMINDILKKYEPAPEDQLSPLSHIDEYEQDRRAWDWHVLISGRVTAAARDMSIPEWAIPNVKAIWDARRNIYGKGPLLFTAPEAIPGQQTGAN